jgi:Xaa-Pro aminopeptidase
LARAQKAAAESGLDALLITPSTDLRYLTGYAAMPLERLTCLVVPAAGDPVLFVPQLEKAAAVASAVGQLGLDIKAWSETEDPYALVAAAIPAASAVAVDNHMWAEKVLGFRRALPTADQRLAGGILRELRMRKSPEEIEASSRRAGDRSCPRADRQWLQAGRSERDVGKDIADAIIAEGHVRVDFVIVGSGPNGASPHHDTSDR